jgi:hypothetical protein
MKQKNLKVKQKAITDLGEKKTGGNKNETEGPHILSFSPLISKGCLEVW